MEFIEQREKFVKHETKQNVSYHYIESIEAANDMEDLIKIVTNLRRICKGKLDLAKKYVEQIINS